jgi:ATP-dependent RNA helicase DeaD
MTNFESVVPALGQALEKRGYDALTPVQDAVLDPKLESADLLVSAQTGSGKTVAFGMALAPTLLDGVDRLPRADAPLALVVAPTRELALQVKRELEWLYAMTGAAVASCVGGMDMRTERRALDRGAHIVVGTPGRLRDHIERGSLDCTAFRAVVLDEADEMLDLGFRDDLEYILGAAPSNRRTLMFSATVPRGIANLAKRFQRDAVRISTTSEREQHHDIEYRALTVAPNDRENAIINVLRYFEAPSALVFCATRAAVNHMTSRFTNRGFSVVALSGELSQNERTHALQAMRDGRARVCIATDVAARGIDLPNLDLVIHADIPRNSETLLHRSGRTGRAGRKGVCTLIVPYNMRSRTDRLLRGAKVQAKWEKPPSADDITAKDDERILADPTLNDPIQENEQAFVQALLAQHGAEQIAAAFTRLYRAGRSAPEELLDNAPPQRSPAQNRQQRQQTPKQAKRGSGDADFANGVWFSLSVGRKHTAEPRWLLPMLCRAGQLTKRDIGAIKIQEEVSHVELSSDAVDRFLEAIGGEGMIEKNITIKRLDKMPTGEAPASETPAGDAPTGEAPKSDTPNAPKQDRDSKRDFDRKPSGPKSARNKISQNKPAYNKPAENKPARHKPDTRYDRELPSQTAHQVKTPESKPEGAKPETSKPAEARAPKSVENKPENKPENKSPLANPADPKSGRRTPSGGKSASGKGKPHKKGWAKAKPKPAFKKPRKTMSLKGDKPKKNAEARENAGVNSGAPDRGGMKPGCAPMKRKKPRNDR